MLLAATTDNLGVMWVAIEATTLATVFLVNLRGSRTSLEAAYKYLILSSVGIALAFIGTALVYYAGAAKASATERCILITLPMPHISNTESTLPFTFATLNCPPFSCSNLEVRISSPRPALLT